MIVWGFFQRSIARLGHHFNIWVFFLGTGCESFGLNSVSQSEASDSI